MERVAVKSSSIKSVGYDEGKRVLEVEFTSGRVYVYAEVTRDEYEALVSAGSVGKYFAERIKGRYAGVPVGG